VRFSGGVVVALVVAALLLSSACSSSGRPGQPTQVKATGWNAFAIIRWRAPSRTGGGPIATYRLVSHPRAIVASVPGNQNWGRVSGLKNGVRYTFTVRAINEARKTSLPSATSNQVTPIPVAINVRENQLVNGAGQTVRLFGVNRSGTEYACVSGPPGGFGIFSGPSDAAIAGMASWHVNAVRVPLNEDCWLGINGVNPAHSGRNYQRAITAYVRALNAAGLLAILDLHWNAPGSSLSDGQQVMADADHAPAFWASVAARFKDRPGVIFDLYNEPRDISWDCWRLGCQTSEGWRTAGMQSLVDAVRNAGASQPIMVAGLEYANDLSGWLSHHLRDPLRQLVAAVHVYNHGGPHYCNTVVCWDREIARVAKKVPVVTGELAEFDRTSKFITTYMRWADRQWLRSRSVSYLGWSWDALLGKGGPSLIVSYDGTPTAFGLGFKTHLERLFMRGEIYQA
jgi:endoglucanase